MGVIKSTIQLVIKNFTKHDVGKNAAALAYYLLFTIFPLIIFFSNLLGILDINISISTEQVDRFMPMDVIASAMTEACDDQISIGLCSTQPGFGKIWVNSFWDTAFVWPCPSNTIALELLVPWSRASMYLSIIMWY